MILCEGYMDCISLHQAGFTEAIASLGTALTSANANNIKRFTANIIIATDMDGAGRSAALRNIDILRKTGVATKIINMEPYKDPDEFIKNLGPEEFQKRLDEAENSFMFEMRMEEAHYDLKDPDGRTRFIKKIAEMMATFEDEIERESYIRAASEKYGLSFDAMKRQVGLVVASNGGEYKPIERPKSGMKEKDPREGIKRTQRVLLTWLSEEPEIYKVIKEYITVQDFTEPVYRAVAEWMFADLSEGKVNPGGYASRFEEEADQQICAQIFNTALEDVVEKNEREKALHDIVLKIKTNSNEALAKKANPSIEDMMQALEGKKALQKLQNITFRLDL